MTLGHTVYAYGVRLGLFPGSIDAGYVTQPDTVENFQFLDLPGGDRFVLALEGLKSVRVSSVTVFYGFDVFSLLPGFPYRVDTWEGLSYNCSYENFILLITLLIYGLRIVDF